MIENAVDDAKDLEAESLAAEKDAQAGYETYMTDANAAIAAKQSTIAEKSSEKGSTDEALESAKGDLKAASGDLEGLEGILKQLHYDCDFLIKNFDIREEA